MYVHFVYLIIVVIDWNWAYIMILTCSNANAYLPHATGFLFLARSMVRVQILKYMYVDGTDI